jgi:peptidyl-prolyl cis-trans isomerase C
MNVRTIPVAAWSVVMLLLVALSAACRNQARRPSDAAVPSASAPSGLTPELAAQVIAKVDGREITLGDYAATLDRMDRFERLRYQSPERRRKLLEEIIKVDLLAAEAKRRGLDQRPETQERVRQVLRDELLERLKRTVPSAPEIPEAEVRVYYEQHRDDFRAPERRRVAHILLTDRALAQTVLMKALSATPAHWGELVRKHSTDRGWETAGTAAPELAGDLGLVSPPGDVRGKNPRVPEAVRHAVFEISELGGVARRLVEAQGKFHIVRMTGKTEAHDKSLAEVERPIRVTLAADRLRKAEQEFERKLREKYPVIIDDLALSKIRVPAGGKGGAEHRGRGANAGHPGWAE